LLTAEVINIFVSRVNKKFYAISTSGAGGFSLKGTLAVEQVMQQRRPDDAISEFVFQLPTAPVALARFIAIQFDSCSDAWRDRAVHFNKLSDFEQPCSETAWFKAGARTNRLKICVVAEKKFLSFSLGSQASVTPIFHG
jgi:hypothetical protein